MQPSFSARNIFNTVFAVLYEKESKNGFLRRLGAGDTGYFESKCVIASDVKAATPKAFVLEDKKEQSNDKTRKERENGVDKRTDWKTFQNERTCQIR